MATISTVISHNMRNLPAVLEGIKTDLTALTTAVNELIADHATFRTAVTQIDTLIEELHDDAATNKTLLDALKVALNRDNTDGVMAKGTILVSATAEKFKTTTTAYYRIGDIQYSKAATDNLVFSAAHTINTAAGAGKLYGAFLVQIDAAGTVSTKAVAADQSYASSAAAIAALPAADTGNVALGYIVVQAKEATDWVANTDDMTAASDCESVSFVDATELTAPGTVSDSAAGTLTATKPANAPATLTASTVTMVTT